MASDTLARIAQDPNARAELSSCWQSIRPKEEDHLPLRPQGQIQQLAIDRSWAALWRKKHIQPYRWSWPWSEQIPSSKISLPTNPSSPSIEKDLIKIILSGDIQTLKSNLGHAVSIGEHHICVGFHEEPGSEYKVWEWHGHVMVFDEEEGYTPESEFKDGIPPSTEEEEEEELFITKFSRSDPSEQEQAAISLRNSTTTDDAIVGSAERESLVETHGRAF